MSVDPHLARILELLSGAPPLSAGTVEQARAGLRFATVDLRDPATLPQVASVEESTYLGAEGPLRARVYRPEADGPVPTVLFAHGGGYVMGDVETHDPQARLLCREVGAVVVSVDYRLAPEHPFPAGHLDVAAALRHVVATVGELGGDATRVAVAGDSAGGNLVGGAAVVARDEGLPLRAQLLLYPSTDFRAEEEQVEHASRRTEGEGYLLTRDDMLWFRQQYQPVRHDPRASLLLQPDLTGLAPAVIATAEHDPLRDEAEHYAALLGAAGVPVVARRYDGLVHGFLGLSHVHDPSHKAALQVCQDLKELLA